MSERKAGFWWAKPRREWAVVWVSSDGGDAEYLDWSYDPSEIEWGPYLGVEPAAVQGPPANKPD